MARLAVILGGALCLAAAPTAAQTLTGDVVAVSGYVLARPHDLALAPDGGFLYVADTGNDRVAVLDPESLRLVGAIGEGDLAAPYDVAFDASGQLLVADSGNDRIAIFALEGPAASLAATIGAALRGPRGVAAAADGSLLVASTGSDSLVRFADGRPVAEISGGGSDAFVRPHDVEILADGRILVADSGNNRLRLFAPDLSPAGDFGAGLGFLDPQYLASDEQGRLFVADRYGDRVVFLDSKGRVIGGIATGRPGEGPRMLHRPGGVAVDGRRLWLAEEGNDRVTLFRLRQR